MQAPKKMVNNPAKNKPMNGEATSPDTPVSGWLFHVMVDAPKNEKHPMRMLKGTNVKARPRPASLNKLPAETR